MAQENPTPDCKTYTSDGFRKVAIDLFSNLKVQDFEDSLYILCSTLICLCYNLQ